MNKKLSSAGQREEVIILSPQEKLEDSLFLLEEAQQKLKQAYDLVLYAKVEQQEARKVVEQARKEVRALNPASNEKERHNQYLETQRLDKLLQIEDIRFKTQLQSLEPGCDLDKALQNRPRQPVLPLNRNWG
jgi:hypothetical protein